nr:E3 ubiquitin-protein ligase BRE1-like 2 isoform X1 [Ipomoea batatas]
MENSAASGEPNKKRPHLNPLVSSPMPRHTLSPSDSKPVDAAVLQYENQKLVRQLDVQKQELHDLEEKMKELKVKQAAYDDILISINRLWNKVDDNMILLGAKVGTDPRALQSLSHADHSRGSIPSCLAEEMFLCRILNKDFIESSASGVSITDVKEALDFRCSYTRELMTSLKDALDAQSSKLEEVANALDVIPSAEDAIALSSKIDDLLKDEASVLHDAIDVLLQKHKEYANVIEIYAQDPTDQSELKRLEVELEESMAELEESRRKLVNLKMQKEAASAREQPVLGSVNWSVSPEYTERTMDVQELKDSIEETQVLADDRLIELQDAKDDNSVLLKQLQDLKAELKDDKFVYSTRAYTILNDQLHHWTAQMERYKELVEHPQVDRSLISRKDKELTVKAESVDAARKIISDSESKIEELEHQLERYIIENNELAVKMEEAIQDSGRKDIKAEFQVMASALSKEKGMMRAQLNRWKDAAQESLSLREEAQSLKTSLDRKTIEQKDLADKCGRNSAAIKSLKMHVEQMQREQEERKIILDMHSQQIYDNRNIMEIQESERRARSQAEFLRNALDEHGLELRIKAANEAEAACQPRLSAAEAELAQLRAELEASDRDVFELREALKIKEGESETYISEIETIGQAYEDMQNQNQHLLQMMAERDELNIKLVSESVKTKQSQSLLLSERHALEKQLQQSKTSLESLKMRIAQNEELMKGYIMEALSSTQEDRELAVSLESVKWELMDAEKELKWLKSSVSSSQKEYDQIQRKIDQIQTELDTERSEKAKLDEELTDLNRTVTELTSESGDAAIQRLEDEINDCKAILKCGVCCDRPKEVVIAKCYHLFCNPCIQRNLELRHRKCPGCGTAFGQNDVRFVKI